eukprot:Awhi_evm1s14710
MNRSQVDFTQSVRASFIFYIYEYFASDCDANIATMKSLLENLCDFDNVMGLQFLLTLDEENKLFKYKRLLFKTVSSNCKRNSDMMEVLNTHFQSHNVDDMKTLAQTELSRNANMIKKIYGLCKFKSNDVNSMATFYTNSKSHKFNNIQ